MTLTMLCTLDIASPFIVRFSDLLVRLLATTISRVIERRTREREADRVMRGFEPHNKPPEI